MIFLGIDPSIIGTGLALYIPRERAIWTTTAGVASRDHWAAIPSKARQTASEWLSGLLAGRQVTRCVIEDVDRPGNNPEMDRHLVGSMMAWHTAALPYCGPFAFGDPEAPTPYVTPQSWRSVWLMRQRGRKDWKEAAIDVAGDLCKRHARAGKAPENDNEAEALLMAFEAKRRFGMEDARRRAENAASASRAARRTVQVGLAL